MGGFMGNASSNNPDANKALDAFFSVFVPTSGHRLDVDWLLQTVFCDETADPLHPNLKIPQVGITGHGPTFIGKDAVRELFEKLVDSFPEDLSLKEVLDDGDGRLYSADGKRTQIGVRTMLTGTLKRAWFPWRGKGVKAKQSYYSKPLSDIRVYESDYRSMEIPAFAVFTFDAPNEASRVSRWSLYLDRYKMMTDLSPPS
jgi:hypothetical protein